MNAPLPQTATFCADYAQRLQAVLGRSDWTGVAALAEDLLRCWKNGSQVFLCGNGGSAAGRCDVLCREDIRLPSDADVPDCNKTSRAAGECAQELALFGRRQHGDSEHAGRWQPHRPLIDQQALPQQ